MKFRPWRAFNNLCTICGALLSAVPACAAASDDASHPLDPLKKDEMAAAVQILRASQDFPDAAVFPMLVLNEPPKEEVLRFRSGSDHGREAFAIVFDRTTNQTFEAVVDLRQRNLTSWKRIADVQPVVMDDEGEELAQIVRADARWQAAMRKRGIENLNDVQVDLWAAGQVAKADPPGSRLLRAVSYFRGDGRNFYGRPIEGVVPLVNMTTKRVIDLTDTGVRPIPPPSQELDEASLATTFGKLRPAPRLLRIDQPDGPSFQCSGNAVRWQKWRFRFALHPRDGLVLYTVGYEDGGEFRPILYRASLSEMVVPYGDPDTNWVWRNAFDVGEYGVGSLATELVSGLDVPRHATRLDAVLADATGSAREKPKCIAIYERDGGLLWKHADYTGWTEARRARQLVICFMTSIGNYDYGVSWIFHQDGVLEMSAVLTGIMLPKGVAGTKQSGHGSGEFGHLVAPQVVAPHHQHFFNFRLDLDVDGATNSAVELNTRADETDEHFNEMIMEETVLRTEREARRQISLETARKWAVVNPSARNSLGQSSSYLLVHGENSIPYVSPRSAIRQRAGFIDHHVWFTRYHPNELHAAGPYPNQSSAGDGLPRWIADDEPIETQDLVLWYTLGVTHVPRPEEWPVMPSTHVGFKLVPAGFFSMNPALDVPR